LGNSYIWVLRKVGDLDAVEAVYRKTGGRYLDKESMATILGVSPDEAQIELEKGVQSGKLSEAYLFTVPNRPDIFIRPEERNTTIRMGDLGYPVEDEDEEVYLSENDTRRIFIAS